MALAVGHHLQQGWRLASHSRAHWINLHDSRKPSRRRSLLGSCLTHSSQTCILNLNGPAESLYGRVYSDEEAVGLLMATGNVGEDLSPPFSTFFSRDAGLTYALLLGLLVLF
jgi:hypothetical protein